MSIEVAYSTLIQMNKHVISLLVMGPHLHVSALFYYIEVQHIPAECIDGKSVCINDNSLGIDLFYEDKDWTHLVL